MYPWSSSLLWNMRTWESLQVPLDSDPCSLCSIVIGNEGVNTAEKVPVFMDSQVNK